MYECSTSDGDVKFYSVQNLYAETDPSWCWISNFARDIVMHWKLAVSHVFLEFSKCAGDDLNFPERRFLSAIEETPGRNFAGQWLRRRFLQPPNWPCRLGAPSYVSHHSRVRHVAYCVSAFWSFMLHWPHSWPF